MPVQETVTRPGLKFEGARVLVIVARDQPDLWWYLAKDFSRFKGVEVILDRRQAGQWQRAQLHHLPERGDDRRSPSRGDTDLRSRPFMIVHPQNRDSQGAELN